MLDNAYGDDTLEELTAAVIMMARIQPADDKGDAEPKYDADAISEVNASQINLISRMLSKGVHGHTSHEKLKTIINTSDDDQIDSNIMFDDPYVENNGGIDEHDSNAHDQSFDIESLVYNVQKYAANQQRINYELKKQKALLQQEFETYKEWVKMLEKKPVHFSKYKEAYEELERKIPKKDFKERENKYLEDIVDLKEKLSSHDRTVYKIGQSIQTIHMLEKKPNKVYDPFLKAGMVYQNLERLKKAIAAQPKMYDGERIHSNKLIIDSPGSDETLEDAKESRLKMKD
ncbi:hypothetical protein Tco_0387304 [Tanacetum coccineum]